MPAAPPLALLEALEDILVSHPAFGNSQYIRNQFCECQTHRLEWVGKHVSAARNLLDALREFDESIQYRLLANTVVSCAIQHALAQVDAIGQYVFSLSQCERIFHEAHSYLRSKMVGSPFTGHANVLSQLRAHDHSVWVWSEQHPDDLFGRSFRLLVKENYGDALCAPDDEDIANLEKGAELLLATSALSHVHLIGCFASAGNWRNVGSSSQIRLKGTIFLSQSQMRDPWWVAEHLLHEALHQKFYEFRHGHLLLSPVSIQKDDRSAESVSVWSPWNPTNLARPNYWDTHRTFAAFHVYVHLALLSFIASGRSSDLEGAYGKRDSLIESGKALDRARYLGEQLTGPCWSELGYAGKEMAKWFIEVLKVIDLEPAPRGAYSHLLFDLYDKERRKVESIEVAAESRGTADLLSRLDVCAREEIEAFSALLTSIDARDTLDRFASAVRGKTGGADIVSLATVRETIGQCLVTTSTSGFELHAKADDSLDPNDFVRQFVERASERLIVALEGLPAGVVAAKQRAKKMRFTKACPDPVGRLLSTLAASTPKRGRILEIGTGVGVGTAWVCAGLDERKDVEVVTVEIDGRLSDSCKTWDWPDYVELLTADAADLVSSIGKFDLVFADAAPNKYENLDSVLSLIRVGGMLLVDDVRTRAGRILANAKIDALRDRLLNDPNLRAVELDWCSGVILAVVTRVYNNRSPTL